ncbi:MAG: hypothetical protein M3342_21785 [Bacteroidota bacterium]|nr:hypothetical protein [Bacteroidota bacterium]
MHGLYLSMRCLVLFTVLLFRLGHLQAQVLVHEEPRHRPVFQNNKIRILNVLLPPGDTTQYHIHHTPSLFLFFTSTSTGSQLQSTAASTGRSTAGSLLFENLAPPHVRVHRVWNMDTNTFHVMDIELLSKDSGFAQKPLMLPHLQLAIDTPWARVYQLTLEAGNDFTFRDTNRSLVLVSLDAAPVQMQQGRKTQQQTVRAGSFFWVKTRQSFALKNTGGAAARFVLLEVPEP